MTERELLELMEEAETKFVQEGYHIYKVQISDLADFIDSYFLPRPLFEDGTPVKVGDEFALHKPSRSEKVVGFCVHDDGSFSVNGFLYDQDQRVMKPEENPEALDADGVPIHVGDKLYFVEGDDTPLKCIGFDDYGNVTFKDWEETGTIAYENPTVFTHKKPDSWEKLGRDAKLCCCEYFGRSYKECSGCKADDPNYHPYDHPYDCNKAKTQDIVRRAKALAGVKDE